MTSSASRAAVISCATSARAEPEWSAPPGRLERLLKMLAGSSQVLLSSSPDGPLLPPWGAPPASLLRATPQFRLPTILDQKADLPIHSVHRDPVILHNALGVLDPE